MLIIAAEMHFYHNYSHFTPFLKGASKQNLRVTLFIVKATSRFASIGRGGHFWHLVLRYTWLWFSTHVSDSHAVVVR